MFKEDIYIFFHDEEEIQSDLFFIFEALMKKGMSNLFNPCILQKDDPGYKMYEIFPQIWKDESDQKNPTYFYRRCDLLIKEKLKSLDNDLYSHFKRIELNCVVILQRYLRCIFCIEFPLNDVYTLWDYILCNNYINENTQKYYFICMEYICIAMIFKIRDTLKDSDQSECYSILLHYPETKDIMEIIKLSQKVEQAINERLNGKNSNVYDILGIMKPIESEPTRIFSEDVYNQAETKKIEFNNNKKNEKIYFSENDNKIVNKNNSEKQYNNKNGFNTIKEEYSNISSINNNIENDNNPITYDKFDEDEKENINLDSINHDNSNNNNDISSQAKSFFNSAINSLTNFGGIIKDQLQNAKDTVIDSFTGNETNTNNNYNEDYNQQNDNYYEYNNSDSNFNNSNNNPNNDNINNYNYENNKNRKDSKEQIEDKNQNNIERKISVDSANEIGYIRQDIIDIVNKLKEFDTRYNMFMNDEDKRNFRIIIDYLKAKI